MLERWFCLIMFGSGVLIGFGSGIITFVRYTHSYNSGEASSAIALSASAPGFSTGEQQPPDEDRYHQICEAEADRLSACQLMVVKLQEDLVRCQSEE